MNRRRMPVRRSHSPGVIRPPRVDLPAAGVGMASQNPFLDRISGPASCAPMMTGALDQTSAAAFRLSPDFGKLAERIELARRMPKPAPVSRAPRQPTIAAGIPRAGGVETADLRA